ncbi:Slp family lipoprotein [Thiorhodospira sibirica]|uniref:Slp family lipoprotein n=1 Tax=Thiorhodospira sibirica TaxID=154347 RepID=UPI0003030BA4|nr:Slp family lipoprotein [Thiorhodospira sibirica]
MSKTSTMSRIGLIALLLVLWLSGCATGPRYDTEGIDLSLSPRSVIEVGTFPAGQRILWGGAIIEVRNLHQSSEIELMAFPLDQQQRPQTHKAAQGRFLAHWPAYLEAMDYAPGRLLTVTGTLIDITTGPIGAATYHYPNVQIEQLHLWPAQASPTRPRLHIGIGVTLGN